MVDPRPPSVAGKRVLIVDPAFLGDVVFDAPLARALRAQGASEVGLLVRPPADALGRVMEGVDRVHVFDKRGADRGLRGLLRAASRLAPFAYGLALLCQRSLRSRALVRLARIPERVAARHGVLGGLLLTHCPPAPRRGFVAQRLALVGASGPRALAGGLKRSDEPASSARIGLLLGAQWATKRWPVDQALALARALGGRARLIALGTAEERPLYAPLLEAGLAEDGTGGGIEALLARLASCALVVGGDTGPLHMARALGVPVVALFGPTPEDAHDFAARDVVLTVPIDCRPCSAHGPPTCPLGHHRCLRDLDGEQVARAALSLLEAP